MAEPDLPHILLDLAKILGSAVKDAFDVGEYRITVIVERKIDDKMGVVIENMSVDKRMSALEVEKFTSRFKELIDKKWDR